ncbi:hypothetical protein BH10PAT2_BH10PAT2_1300 [soil metagenome]
MHSQPKFSVVAEPDKTQFAFSLKKKVCVVVIFLLLLIGWAVIWTALSLQSIKVGDFSTADTEARVAHPVVRLLSLLTLQSNSDLELWDQTLTLIQEGYDLEVSTQTYIKLALQNDPQLAPNARELESNLKETGSSFQKIIPLTKKSLIYKKIILPKLPPKITAQLEPDSQLVQALPVLETAVDTLFTGHHRFILLLQNSDELRATGGFMGSYAVLDFNMGSLSPIQFYDIYDADGQIQTTIPAPAGVNEYLSGGQGLRLPNANWNPDFPSSAQDILHFFALAHVQEVDGVIAVNLSLVEQLLTVTGPVQIQETNQTVTANNLSEVARADRESYFPGSKQKKNFLQALSTQLRLKVQNLTPAQQKQLASEIAGDILQKNIQLFFHDPDLQAFVQTIQGTGQVTASFSVVNQDIFPKNYLMLIESNVGINKANKKITREVKIDLQDRKTTVEIHYENQNSLTSGLPATASSALRENPRNDYINYQRLLLPSGSVITQLEQDGKPVPVRDQNELVTSTGEHFAQVGFLVPVPEQQQSTVILSYTEMNSFQINPTLVVQKQSGLPSTFYSVTYGSQSQNFQLDQDKVIQFQP